MADSVFFKIVCVDENNPLEYGVLEDANRGTIQEALDFVGKNYRKHDLAKWILLPYPKCMIQK